MSAPPDRAEELFHAALAVPATERESFLERTCGKDASLLGEVRSLLRHDTPEESFLSDTGFELPLPEADGEAARGGDGDARAGAGGVGDGGVGRSGGGIGRSSGGIDRSGGDIGMSDAAGLGPLEEGTWIGPYRVARELGEGGMARVYLVEQREPVERMLALKLLKMGMDTEQVLIRFERERQTLARMTHPHIAKVIDAGSTDRGRPFFVMEYVEGTPLLAYCDERRLGIDERLRLFLNVCDAVQHAHQKGVIHRDLKPSNILVTEASGRPQPRIIDFGIAKAMSSDEGELTLTERGMMVGTPEFMSPEQAGLGDTHIDTRSDIYSLGMVLYVVLAGGHPLGETLRGASYGEIQRRVAEASLARPSEGAIDPKLAASELLERAGRRALTPKELNRALGGDLDWICMSALERDPERRYASAAALAEDIRRHLDLEPVSAGPPGAAYRLGKLMRRHRTVFVAAGVVLLALTMGLIASLVSYKREEAARRELAGLSDLQRLSVCLAEADLLWPATPDNIPAMDRWLEEQALPLRERLSVHEATLQRLRRRGVITNDDSADDAARLAELEEILESGRLALARMDELGEFEGRQRRRSLLLAGLDEAEAERADLDSVLATRPRGANGSPDTDARRDAEDPQTTDPNVAISTAVDPAADPAVQWQHDNLVELIAGIETLGDPADSSGVIGDVLKRRAFAANIGERSVSGAKASAAWGLAIEEVARSPHYGGLSLAAQIGLMPLGTDPRTGLQEFAVLQTGEAPARDEAGTLVMTEESALVLVLLPGGSFGMGSRPAEPGHPRGSANVVELPDINEQPVHAVELAPFFLSKFEMSQGQWVHFTGANPSVYETGDLIPGGGVATALHPVERVSWETCDRVLTQLGLSLPTESQWEYAARGGTATSWWTGDRKRSLEGAANLADQAAKRGGSRWSSIDDWPQLDDGYPAHCPVDRLRPNGFGLHNVHGNVWEWCLDIYALYEFPTREGDGLRRAEDSPNRLIRGGGYSSRASAARAGRRVPANATLEDGGVGVRPARTLDPALDL